MIEEYFAADERNQFSMILSIELIIKKKKTISDSNNFHKPWFGFLIHRREQNWSLERIFLSLSSCKNIVHSRNWIGFPYFTHNPHHLYRAEQWVLHISLYAWIHLPYMEFVTFTIKKSLFIIESGQTEHVRLETSIRREGNLESMWHSLLHLEFPVCLPRLFFPNKSQRFSLE